MDDTEFPRLDEILRQNTINAERYAIARRKAAEAKYYLDVLIGAGYLDGTLEEKTAYEKVLIIIASKSDDNKKTYKELIISTAEYKGLEKVLEINSEQIRWAQSKMKYNLDGEING